LSGVVEEDGGAAAAAKIFGMTIEPGIDTNRLNTRPIGGSTSRDVRQTAEICDGKIDQAWSQTDAWRGNRMTINLGRGGENVASSAPLSSATIPGIS